MTIEEAVCKFLYSHFDQSDRSPKTRSAYTRDLAQFCTFVTIKNVTNLSSLEASHCESWVVTLKERELASATIKRKLATVKCFFNYCVLNDWIDRSPFDRLRFRLETARALPKCLTISDATKMIDHVSRNCRTANDSQAASTIGGDFLSIRNAAILEILFSTGIRVGELTTLDLSSLDEQGQTIRIDGKGGRQRFGSVPIVVES
jgi:site-specific recombinase XerD